MGGASFGGIEDLPVEEQDYLNKRLRDYRAAQEKRGLARVWALRRWRRNGR